VNEDEELQVALDMIENMNDKLDEVLDDDGQAEDNQDS